MNDVYLTKEASAKFDALGAAASREVAEIIDSLGRRKPWGSILSMLDDEISEDVRVRRKGRWYVYYTAPRTGYGETIVAVIDIADVHEVASAGYAARP